MADYPEFPGKELHVCPICGKQPEYIEVVERVFTFGEDGMLDPSAECMVEVREQIIDCCEEWSIPSNLLSTLEWKTR